MSAVVLVSGCSQDAQEPVPEPIQGRPVKIIEIRQASGERSTTHPAVIDASRSRDLAFAVSGVLAELSVNETQEVAEGEPIARLDSRDYENSRNAAQASFDNADSEYQRALRLAKQDAIASSVLEQRRAQRDQAVAQLDIAQKAVQDSTITAPFAGVIADVLVKEGDSLIPGRTVAKLISVDTLEASIQLPASVLSGAQTRQDLGAFVLLEAIPDAQIPAEFSEADLIADTTSQTYKVTFMFTPPENLIVLPGMNAKVVLRTGTSDEAVATRTTVPLAAVESDGDGEYVWIVEGDPLTVSRRAVLVEPGVGENLVVTSGLQPGDRIVGAGGAYLSEGIEVSEWSE